MHIGSLDINIYVFFLPRSYAHRESGHKYLCFFGQEAMHIGSLDINIYAFFCQEAMHIGSLDINIYAFLAKKLCTSGVWT